jgi:alkylation response protein AidB-like acyl-CoA dehydrogenase
MADGVQASLDAFRAEARAWLEENFPKSLSRRMAEAQQQAQVEEEDRGADYQLWKKRIGEKGWGVPTWPAQYGGGGLSQAQAQVLREEMGRIGAINPIGGMGVGMFGPTLIEFGNETQKQLHIRRIAKGEVRWCQGFSEPGSGSDLASLQTKAEDKGDHFLVNGQKIWTSGAHMADWCFCLVRTDPSKKHEGISMVMIDMKTPGVNPRPIRLINDTTPFCETFFTDVKVPKENLVGELNRGWTYAKRLLQHERSGAQNQQLNASAQPAQRDVVPDLAREYIGLDGEGKLLDRDLRARIAEFEMMRQAFSLTARRSVMESRHANGPSTTSSIMKNVGSFVRRDVSELSVEIIGNRAFGWKGSPNFKDSELEINSTMLRSKAGTIAAGSQEVQLNIISKRILGLPDMTGSTNQ